MKNVVRILGLCLAAAILIGIPFLAQPVAAETPSVTETEINTYTYCYDRISPQAQWWYNYLKALYDDLPHAIEEEQYYYISHDDVFPENMNLDNFDEDFWIAKTALKRDNPHYELKVDASGILCEDFGLVDCPYLVRITLRKSEYDSYISDIPDDWVAPQYHTFLTEDRQQRVNARIQQIVSAVGEGDRYTKLLKLTRYLLENTYYDPYLDEFGSPIPSWAGTCCVTAYGVLLENVAICSSYAKVVKLLCNELAIPCLQVENSAHAWNIVQMEDGGWYILDMTLGCRLGRDGESKIGDYLAWGGFLNNDLIHTNANGYRDPYMFSLDDVKYITDIPKLAEGRYIYTGSTTDFSYTEPESTYVPGEPTFRYWVNKDGKTCILYYYEGRESGDLIIPETIDGYTVTAIEECTFVYCTGFNGKLVLPDTIEYIGSAAFAGCYGLTAVKWPANLRSIGRAAFIGCTGLSEVRLPDLVTEVGEYAFYDCNKISDISIGEHILSIGEGAFENVSEAVVIKAPANSEAQRYAENNGISFQSVGTLCDFEDADGDWEFDNHGHFYTCRHGAQIDRGLHVVEDGCGAVCSICDAQRCYSNGYREKGLILTNTHPADCNQSEYTGDWVCVCGKIVQYGKYVGERGPCPVEDQTWYFDDTTHYKRCTYGHPVGYTPHSWEDVEIIREPTCKEEGLKTCVCSVCGATTTATINILRTHSYDNGVVTKEPTCKESGIRTFTCTVCEGSYTQSILKLTTHSYDSGVVTKEPTCEEIGTRKFTCTVCGSRRHENIAKLTHNYDNGVVTKEPTCKEKGIKTFTCTGCNKTRTETIAKLTTHSYDNGVETTAPTCGENGVKTFTCTVCGDSYTEEIAKLTTHSYNGGVVTKEPTCKEAGVKTTICTVCRHSYTEEIAKLTTHKYNKVGVVTKEPTCKETGIKTFTCRVCGDSYTEEIAKLTTHSYDSGVVTKDPTCKETGVKTTTCTVCGDSYTNDVAKLPHSYDSGVVTKDPTCKETGVKKTTCTVCGDSYTDDVAKLPHSYENGACAACGKSDPNYVPPTEPETPTEPGATEPTEPEVPVEQEKNPFDAIIQIIMQFLAVILAIFGIKL